ncbi:recombinase family protein [Streptomyces sp. NPDC052109]|uniref:recombinase family protein n=1 Tax=Streptomyces sp. NPDC052109 TaxID=3155527 RepID=UPI00342B3CC2
MSYDAIAAQLTLEGIPCPSHDAARNPHRKKTARQQRAVRALLLNARYTGYEVWNKQRNPVEEWIHSIEPAHEAIISPDLFDAARIARTARPQRGGGRSAPANGARAPTLCAAGSGAACAGARCSPPPSAAASTSNAPPHRLPARRHPVPGPVPVDRPGLRPEPAPATIEALTHASAAHRASDRSLGYGMTKPPPRGRPFDAYGMKAFKARRGRESHIGPDLYKRPLSPRSPRDQRSVSTIMRAGPLSSTRAPLARTSGE